MGAPHKRERYGELSDPVHLAVLETEIRAIAGWVTVSGGWAWHFMTPEGHQELKHAHDHKDADLFVSKQYFGAFVALLKDQLGFERTWTRFHRRDDAKNFYRLVKIVDSNGTKVKVIFDLFVDDVPWVEARGVRVTEPSFLLSLYGRKHSSVECFSVQIAKELLARGESPWSIRRWRSTKPE